MRVAPYPHGLWTRLSRAEARLLDDLCRGLRSDFSEIAAAAQPLLGARLLVRPSLPELCNTQAARAALRAPFSAGLFRLRDGARSAALAIELSSPLGAALVDRLLGGEGDGCDHALRALDDLELGVLCYLAARLAAEDGALELCAVSADADELLAWLSHEPFALWPFRVELATNAFHARAWLGAAACRLLARKPPRPTRAPPDWLRALPLAVDAVAARTCLTRRELAELRDGDVVLPEHCALRREARGWRGQVELAIAGASRAAFSCRAAGDTLIIDTRVARHPPGDAPAHPTTRGRRMSKTDDTPEDPIALGGDAPIELELCIARFRLSLRELAALSPGQVLDTGQPIGQRVTLRAAGQSVAEGELVEVDGDVGIRILSLSS